MTGSDLLTRLRATGLTVAVDGDALKVRPSDLLTDELRAVIRENKRALLAELPRYRWRVIDLQGNAREVCCLPEMTAAEMRACYPDARLLPLPDAMALA